MPQIYVDDQRLFRSVANLPRSIGVLYLTLRITYKKDLNYRNRPASKTNFLFVVPFKNILCEPLCIAWHWRCKNQNKMVNICLCSFLLKSRSLHELQLDKYWNWKRFDFALVWFSSESLSRHITSDFDTFTIYLYMHIFYIYYFCCCCCWLKFNTRYEIDSANKRIVTNVVARKIAILFCFIRSSLFTLKVFYLHDEKQKKSFYYKPLPVIDLCLCTKVLFC